MERKTFSTALPTDLCEALDEEAFKTFRKKNARNQMIVKILTDRYQLELSNTGQPHSPRNSALQAKQQTDVD